MLNRSTTRVLGLLCVMYFITYVDRVNVSTAAIEFSKEFHLSNTQVGLVFSAFAYPYLLFQVIGGWVGDRFGPRRTLTICSLVWAGATVLMGLSTGLVSHARRARSARLGRRRDLSDGDARNVQLDSQQPARIRARYHARVLEDRQRRNATDRDVADGGVQLARLIHRARTVQPRLGHRLGMVFPRQPADHAKVTTTELDTLPAFVGVKETPRVPWSAAHQAHAAGHAGVLLLRLDPVAVSDLDSAVLPAQLPPEPEELRAVRLGRVLRRRAGRLLGGNVTDWLLTRTGSRTKARSYIVVVCNLAALASLLPILFIHDSTIAAIALSSGSSSLK